MREDKWSNNKIRKQAGECGQGEDIPLHIHPLTYLHHTNSTPSLTNKEVKATITEKASPTICPRFSQSYRNLIKQEDI